MYFLKSARRYLTNINLYNARINAVYFSFKNYLEPSVAIVGSGPSAFYTAQSILKNHKHSRVDIFEKMPAPFGLVRYGVAPDHPEVKVICCLNYLQNVINTFTNVAQNKRFNFFGNVAIGKDISMKELKHNYSAVILAYGASQDNLLNIPGEFHPDLDHETVAVIGIGNVALDVARILLSPIKRLHSTDIPLSVEEVLSKSKVKKIVIISRRGPFHVAFTIKEFRELINLSSSRENAALNDYLPIHLYPDGIMEKTIISENKSVSEIIDSLARPRKRLLSLLKDVDEKNYAVKKSDGKLSCDIQFLRSPIEIIAHRKESICAGKSAVKGVKLAINRLIEPLSDNQGVTRDDDANSEILDCGLVIRSVGYRSIQIDDDIPFDHEKGVIKCKDAEGRVAFSKEEEEKYKCIVYAVGWAKRGAKGVIVNTAVDARLTAETVLKDIAEHGLKDNQTFEKCGTDGATDLLSKRGVQIMSFDDWEKVDLAEKKAGESVGKPREKILSVESMLKTAFSEASKNRK